MSQEQVKKVRAIELDHGSWERYGLTGEEEFTVAGDGVIITKPNGGKVAYPLYGLGLRNGDKIRFKKAEEIRTSPEFKNK